MIAQPTPSTTPTPQRRTRWRRRAALAVGLLAALFVMHGMSAFAALACNYEAAPKAVQSMALPASSELATAGAFAESMTQSHCTDEQSEACVAALPSPEGTLLVALLLGLAWGIAQSPALAGLFRTRTGRVRRAVGSGPPLLLKVCVSRT